MVSSIPYYISFLLLDYTAYLLKKNNFGYILYVCYQFFFDAEKYNNFLFFVTVQCTFVHQIKIKLIFVLVLSNSSNSLIIGYCFT